MATLPRAGITKTFLLSKNKETLDKSDIIALNRDLENIFMTLQNIQTRRKELTGAASLAKLLTALDELGIIKDSTT